MLNDSIAQLEERPAQLRERHLSLAALAEKNQTLDILATREALLSMPDGGYGYEYNEGYNPHTSSYVCQQSTYIGQDRYEQSLVVSLEDGTATVNSTWGSMSYWDRFVYPPQGEPYYAGTVDDPYRQPPSWVVEKPLYPGGPVRANPGAAPASIGPVANFEERVDARRAKILAANRHRTFRCVECGERYTYDWVYEYGMICSEGCDGELVEVRNG